jgi:hypothetical protein
VEQERSYQTGGQPGHPALPIVVERRVIQRTLDALRASPRRLCWWCARPLERGVCRVCDAEGWS